MYCHTLPGPLYGAQSFPDPFDDASLASNPIIDAGWTQGVNIIPDDNSTADGNIFCLGAFADKHTGTLYNDLTSTFPFMSLNKNVCYLIDYHYETNVMLALPIANLEDTTIFEGYKKQFEFLESNEIKLKSWTIRQADRSNC
jgi:hypothetical protein